MADKIYALIPAYKPDRKLIKITKELVENGFDVVIVDDGSGAEYEDIFRELLPWAQILRHDKNMGKGAALKTGLAFIAKIEERIQDEITGYTVVTLDADGQHSIDDVIRVAKASEIKTDALILGTRSFDTQVPVKSRLGNDITRAVFSFVAGVRVNDTQTGLRAFSGKLVNFMLGIDGDRYEYEINVLLESAEKNIPIEEIPIETIYIDDNKNSHFHAVKDSFLIYAQILKHINIRMERRGAGW